MKKLISSILLFIPLLFWSPAQAASFSCKAVKLKAEQQICNDLVLNDADVKLATTYQIILHALPMGGRDAEKDQQFKWLKQRNSCGANSPCLKRAYAQRQQQLDQLLQTRVLSQGPF
ncbi:lysozyme inhibitor LprI family protein [Acinetobacter gyllenbergii]|uniref:lysozyme inhibitor LprI family protein n=1 Tax=Acinetobacter gyllenbergii TaxID=134534 RepID=UPI003F57A01B